MKITPRDYQQELMDKVLLSFRSKKRRPLVVAATGAGKCLAADTPVLMYDGTIKVVQDIVVGDLLMGPDGQPRRVESLAHGREQMYRVTPSKGDPYTVNESHILSLRNARTGIVRNISVLGYMAEPAHWRIRNPGWRVPGVLRGDLRHELTDITVERVGPGDYYGFEISGPDRLFLLGDFTVTHNTVVFSAIASRAASKGNKVLILAHRDTLIKQASAKLRDYEVTHGIIMAGFTPSLHAKVQVASVQTMVRRLKGMAASAKAAADKARDAALSLGKSEEEAEAAAVAARKAKGFDLIIIDEAHLSAAKSYLEILNHFPDAFVIGFTGSPCRLDNKPLGKESGGIYDDLIQAISIRQLIDRGFLVQPRVYGAEQELDLSSIKKSMGDYKTDELAAVVDKPKIIGDAVSQYQKICPGAPAVAWCVTVAHAQHVADAFNAAGIKAVMLCGDHETSYRDQMLKGLETGEVQVITFVGILIEGVDCPAISAIIMLRPTMSLASYLQVIGRGLRPYTSPAGIKKEVCFVLDHASLWRKHGFADEERIWDLNGEVKRPGKKKKEDEKVDLIQCKGCFAVFAPAPACPFCGTVVEAKTRKLEHIDGELKEITPEMVEDMRKDKQKEVKGAKTLEELQKIAAQRGYSPGWAKHAYEARQRAKEKYKPALRPPEPSVPEMKVMSLEQLEKVASEQGWPRDFASEFYHTQGAGADLFNNNQQAPGGQ